MEKENGELKNALMDWLIFFSFLSEKVFRDIAYIA
jgi:hypothetical protein